MDYLSKYSDLSTRSKSHDVEIFQINGHGQFMAFANQGRKNDMVSTIFKWTGNKFEVYQNITTDNARKWEFFTIGTEVSLEENTSYKPKCIFFLILINIINAFDKFIKFA